MKHLFKNGRMSPLLCGLAFVVAMLFCSSEASAQLKASLQDSYGLNLKSALVGKTLKSGPDAMSALMNQATIYRNDYANQQGNSNEALHLLRIDYFTKIAAAIDNGLGVDAALQKELDATLLAEAKNYGPMVNGAAVQSIYNEAITLVSL